MKQLIIGQKKAYATGVTYNDITKVPEGTIGIFKPIDGSLVTTKDELTSNFAVVCGRATGEMPLHFPEVDVKTLQVVKATYKAGQKFTATITIPATEKGKEYTIIVVKKGVVFNERNRWSYTQVAKGTTAADVAKALVKSINANTETSGVTAEVVASSSKVKITAAEIGKDFEVIGADELMGVIPTDVTTGVPAELDKADIQDLASRCAAGKGFNYTDNPEIYPGYPEVVADDQYVLYTLRFAVPRVASKQRDEVVYQLLHIAVPVGSGVIATLDAIFEPIVAEDAAAAKE